MARFVNAALLAELRSGGVLSTPARDYAQKVIRRSERAQARNVIIEEAHNKLKAAVTTRKTILSGKRKVIDGEHILTTPKVLHGLENAERETKKENRSQKCKRVASRVEEESSDESEASQAESVVVLDCIEVA